MGVRIKIFPGLSNISKTGIWTYTVNLNKFMNSERSIQCDIQKEPKLLNNTQLVSLRRFLYLIWLLTILPINLLKGGREIIHFTNFICCPRVPGKTIYVTIHDLFGPPENYTLIYYWYLRFCLIWSLIMSHKIFVGSLTIKNELISRSILARYFSNKINLLPPLYLSETTSDGQYTDNELNNYFLCFGTHSRLKNFASAISAFEILKDEKGYDHRNYKLYIVGKNGDDTEKLKSMIKNSKYKDDILLLGFVSQKIKNELWKNCLCILHTSLYEGYGYNIVEAKNYKKVILCSDIPVNEELLNGRRYIYGDSTDSQMLANQLVEVLRGNLVFNDENFDNITDIEFVKNLYRRNYV